MDEALKKKTQALATADVESITSCQRGAQSLSPIPPLVPPEVDLAGYQFMPLHGHKLFSSDFNLNASDAGFRAAVNLWWSSWNQVPAGSLPSIVPVLAGLAGLGRGPHAVKAFLAVRSEALYGFIECADGRLYHPKLAEWALEAWERRVKERDRKAKWRSKQSRDDDVPETGTTTGQHHDRDCSGDAMSQLKRSGREVKRSESEIQKRDVELLVPSELSTTTPGTKPAIGQTTDAISRHDSTGQQWNKAEWVGATATTLNVQRRHGESDNEFRDRIFSAVRQRQNEAKTVASGLRRPRG